MNSTIILPKNPSSGADKSGSETSVLIEATTTVSPNFTKALPSADETISKDTINANEICLISSYQAESLNQECH